MRRALNYLIIATCLVVFISGGVITATNVVAMIQYGHVSPWLGIILPALVVVMAGLTALDVLLRRRNRAELDRMRAAWIAEHDQEREQGTTVR
jgi:hypothetical protein